MFVIDQQACIGCGQCERECRVAAITLTNAIAQINQALCIQCGVCADICPVRAIAPMPSETAAPNQIAPAADAALNAQAEQPRANLFAQIARAVIGGLRSLHAGGSKGRGNQQRFRGGR